MNLGIEQYQNTAKENVATADPHRIIQMLLQGALDRIATAKGYMQRGEIAEKGKYIGKAISIIQGLQTSLNFEEGGDLSADLEQLYDYMTRKLMEANRDNTIALLDEVTQLLTTIKEGWDGIPHAVREQYAMVNHED